MQKIKADNIKERLLNEFLSQPIMDNSLRGYWCEAMVAEALGAECQLVGKGWHPWDLQIGPDVEVFPKRIRIQVKNSARIQQWNVGTGKLSDTMFNLKYSKRPDYFKRDNPSTPCEEFGFMCDVFVLCHHPAEDILTADQMDPKQWEFFVLPVAGKGMAVTEAEISMADQTCRNTGRPSNLQRRPATMMHGIRGRKPVIPVSIDCLANEVRGTWID